MKIFKLLSKYRKKRRGFYSGEEYSFYLLNKHLLAKMPKFNYILCQNPDEFEIMRYNILIQSLINKTTIEIEVATLNNYVSKGNKKVNYDNFITKLKEKIVDQPYVKDETKKIYIPFLSKTINSIYVDDPIKLTSEPYKSLIENFNDTLIDPFDAYGYHLFDSYFTKLIKVMEKDDTAAFFHYDTNTIYIVNNQGRLDNKIVLFDRFIHKPNLTHMLERIKPVLSAYYASDKDLFLEELKKESFISPHIYYLAKLLDWRKK